MASGVTGRQRGSGTDLLARFPPQTTHTLCVSKLPASQQLVGTVTPALDQPRTLALPLPIVCHLLGMGISCALRDFTNLPCHCPITHTHSVSRRHWPQAHLACPNTCLSNPWRTPRMPRQSSHRSSHHFPTAPPDGRKCGNDFVRSLQCILNRFSKHPCKPPPPHTHCSFSLQCLCILMGLDQSYPPHTHTHAHTHAPAPPTHPTHPGVRTAAGVRHGLYGTGRPPHGRHGGPHAGGGGAGAGRPTARQVRGGKGEGRGGVRGGSRLELCQDWASS